MWGSSHVLVEARRCWSTMNSRSCFFQCWEPGDAVRCFDKQYEYRGRCCNRCHPGEKLVSECSDTEDSICTPCESGHYQQSWTKEKHCAPHDICEDNTGLIVKTHGNATHNTVCQCRAGTHCSDTSCQTCVENQPCQRGFGFVAAKAMARMTSPCEPCAEGTFSNVSSKTEPCHPWTSSFNTSRPGPWRGALLCTWSPHRAALAPGPLSLCSLAGFVQDTQQLLLAGLPMCPGCCGYTVLFFSQLRGKGADGEGERDQRLRCDL
ncbi:tumor necrosis factor receptor superfamily member 5 isoform X3 [Lathamus discolor]|uniref:tumor necrosis factor receptor superfamily member 5 isoform X3 n=1 Tax=Lathamus discolor TaxID=678569 RepID=UPI0032B84C4B